MATDIEELKKSLTETQIVKLLYHLGSENYFKDTQDNLIFKTVCHGGNSYKLYYYNDTQTFHCYTDCGDNFDIIELIMRNKRCNFGYALYFIGSTLGIEINNSRGFKPKHVVDDLDYINKYYNNAKMKKTEEFKYDVINPTILNYFSDFYHESWINEGITEEVMDKYDISFNIIQNKIIIPHYDIEGNLIGIRGRALNPEEVEFKGKYRPVYINNTLYNHPLQYNLYGLNINKEAIMKTRKIMLFEAEKSVMKCDVYYGENNFTVATCGSTLNEHQIRIILGLGVKEAFIAYDKEYAQAGTPEADKYAEKLLKLARKLAPYMATYILWDDCDMLGLKDSPADKGKEVLEFLMKNKYEITTKEGEY